ncbi:MULTISPECIES: hypothetical protein [Cyanophyceae]|uniref:hypothetical protein n=1 Tax=Cyanophyceae TaxID=3028117 RepID=UPI0016890AC7|nr:MULTISPECIES: hypothetical protein [Cyanophyceae]MBD1914290.1 hypothetical protein [Phormidium sp. FACHB-77]MBD2031225.1 hypothetical protein [Phormidium sp. FACHB-322]MBD2049624.1 hypothetical protein [Leptolyngbya sp. FACHB-60]
MTTELKSEKTSATPKTTARTSLMRSNYTTTKVQKGRTLDEQLANIEDRGDYPNSLEIFKGFSKNIKDEARKRMGWLSCKNNVVAPFIINGLKDLGVEPDVFLVAAADVLFEITADKYRKSDNKRPFDAYICSIPAGILTSKLTGHPYEKCISHSHLKGFHRAMVEEVFSKLSKIEIDTKHHGRLPLITISGYSAEANKCRQYNILGLLELLAIQIEKGCKLRMDGLTDEDPKDFSSPSAPHESIRKNKGRLDSNLVKAIEVWQNSPFRLVNHPWIVPWMHEKAMLGTPEWNHSQKGREIYLAKLRSYVCALRAMDPNATEAQYVGPIKASSSGRLCPQGGSVVNLASTLSMLLIQPTPCARPRVKITIDLKCAQLIELAVILGNEKTFEPDVIEPDVIQGCKEALERLKQITQAGESVWPHIAPAGFDLAGGGKQALKEIVYGAAYGLKRQHMLHTANESLEKDGLDFRFYSIEEIDRILEGPILRPLMVAREAFFEKYSLDNVKKILRAKKGGRVIKNAVGCPFRLADQLKRFEDEEGTDVHKIAGRLLAHLGQGKEQQVMHDFVANCVGEFSAEKDIDLLLWKYDGLTLAVPMEEEKWLKQHCQEWLTQHHPNHVFDAETHWFLTNPQFWRVAQKIGPLRLIEEGRTEIFNCDMALLHQ